MEKRIKIRIGYSICLMILGMVSVLVGAVWSPELSDYLNGFYVGVGGGLIAAGFLTIIRNFRILRNPEKLKEKQVFENDERNKMIGLKTWSYAGYALFLLLYVGMLFAGFVDEMVLNTILAIMAVYALCLFGAGLYCRKTM